MGISHSISHAINHLVDDDLSASLLHVCAAIDATAQQAYPQWAGRGHTGKRFMSFVDSNAPLIRQLLSGGMMSRSVIVRHPYPTKPNEFVQLGYPIYSLIRNPLMHNADLDPNAVLSQTSTLLSASKIHVNQGLVAGLILSVVGEPKNRTQVKARYSRFRLFDLAIDINSLWGDLPAIHALADEFTRRVQGVRKGTYRPTALKVAVAAVDIRSFYHLPRIKK